ncbi:hypothetical protein GOP47_0024526 [Adiantum capillus-veneris]|uniref:Methyltransferase type 11 domain-containing protein n=1 Tax=Adiantum capillus-veneris TaxID=13818 RepID=A0A9D4U4M6_ADICA|nr:hypothetical protein GOP47_0024526 [Adiantum capillus-veneris]
MAATKELGPRLLSASAVYSHPFQQTHALSRSCLLSFSSNSFRSSRMYSPVGTRHFLHSRDRASSSVLVASSFPDEVASSVTLGTALAALIGFGGFRAFVYFKIQYIIAALLGNHVPRGGSKVLDMDIHEGRNLYYYPSDVAEVVAVTNEKNREVIKNQAVRAGVPVDIKVKALSSLSLPSNSMDAVVSVYCLCNLKNGDTKTVLREAIRLLKPGKPFIFVENVQAEGEFLRSCQLLFHRVLQLFGVQSAPPKELSKVLEEAQGIEKLSYETVFGYQDPHIVGLAVKQMEAMEGRSKKRANKKAVSS